MNEDKGLELAKEAIKDSIEAAKEFVGKLVGPGLEEGGGIIQDNIKFWRFKNQINILLKAKEFLEEKGIAPQKVLPKTLIPLVENGSLEEHDDMQTKWAALLANAADPTNSEMVSPNFPEILKELSPLEVKLLDKLFDTVYPRQDSKVFEMTFDKKKILPLLGISSEKFNIIMDNLFRLNLCQPPASFGGVSIGNFPIVLRTYDVICFTPLGYEFVKACRYD